MIDRLAHLATLQDGWLDGDGKAVTAGALQAAKVFLTERADLADLFSIFATEDGGVEFEFERGKWDLSVEILPSGRVALYGVKIDGTDHLYPIEFPGVVPELSAEIFTRIER